MASSPAAPRTGPLAAPELAAPTHGAIVRGVDATLSWQPVEGAAGYRVQVAADEAFRQLYVDARLGPVTQLTVQNLLGDEDGVIWWRVATISGSVAGPFGKDAEFQMAYPSARGPHGPSNQGAPITGRREFALLCVALVLTLVGAVAAFVFFPGLDGRPEEQMSAQDSTRAARLAEQDSAGARLTRYTSPDSAAYTVPIDAAIGAIAREDSGRAGTVTLLPDAGR